MTTFQGLAIRSLLRPALAAVVAAFLFAGAAQATTYTLLANQTATGGTPTTGVQPGGQNNLLPLQNQLFRATVSGNGSVSCTVQIWASVDGVSWGQYGSAFTASGTTSSVSDANGSIPYPYFAAQVTAISGINATCGVSLSG